MDLVKELNNNQGVIEAVGLFLVVPLSLLASKIIEWKDNEYNKRGIEEILQHELWINLNLVSQIEDSFDNTLRNNDGYHIPHYAPRNEVITKIIEFNLVKPLKSRLLLLEIYAQLSELKDEFIRWREKMPIKNNALDKASYKILSSTVLSIVDPLMRNMMDLWLRLLLQQKSEHLNSGVQSLKNELKQEIKNGGWLRTSYKSSKLENDPTDKNKYNIIVCWTNDSNKRNKKIIEIKNKVALFDSWKKT